MKGMVLTAGLGTRLKPLTEKTPKALVPIGGFKMLDLSFAYLAKHGIEDYVINVHHLADQMMEYVMEKRWDGLNIDFSDETSELLNTGGAIKKAVKFLKDDDFVLMACDVVTDLDLSAMIEAHKKSGALVTLAVKERKTSRSLMFDKQMQLAGWKNNQTGETKAVEGKVPVKGYGFSAIHIISPAIFELIEENGAFSIIDLYLRLASTQKILGFDHTGDKWLEFGKVENIQNAETNPDFVEIVNNL